jgi:hypothetical protein
MSLRPFPLISLIILAMLAGFIFSLAGMFAWLRSRPSWVLSAENSPAGLIVEVHQSDAQVPTYVAVLKGKTMAREFSRLKREELSPADATTLFYDETVKPGRWTLNLDRTKVDIMPSRLIIDDNGELRPGQRTEIDE